jgi:predicted CXXCH cytochrome family protein
VVVLLSILLALLGLPRDARAADDDLSKESLACLKCHDKPDLARKLEDGKTLSLHVSTTGYQASMHKKQDCTDCHSNLDDKTHGKVKTPMQNRRELMAAMQETCRDCHKKKFKQYDDGIHAALVKAGNDKAPLCASCHNAHTQTSVKLLAPIDQTPCATCHDQIFAAYKADVHGQERIAQGKKAPICADCHQAHDVKAASLGEGIKDTCIGCHQDTVTKHKVWLPNTELHFDAISCPACHAPTAQRRVNLRLVDGTTHKQLREKTGVPQFALRASGADAGKLGLDERALMSLLTQFSQDGGANGNVMVRGRLEVKSGVQAHQLSEKGKALKDCDTCHQAGAEPFQSVSITIAGADGRPLRHAVQKDVLSSLTALESVRGFYAIGSTRIKLLDWLLLLAVSGSIAGALGHMTVKRLFKGTRERRAAEAQAQAATQARAQTDTSATPGAGSNETR